MKYRKYEKKTSWISRIVIFLGLVLLVLIAFATYKESNQKKQVQDQINSLKAEADQIASENMTLNDKIGYLGSKDYQEKEAKDIFNLRGPEENVVVIKPTLTKVVESSDSPETNGKKLIINTSNIQKWWDYFFKL